MSTTPINTASYQAIPGQSQPQPQPRLSGYTLNLPFLPTPVKYGLIVLGTVTFTLLALSAISPSASTHLAFPRTNMHTQMLPDKKPTTLIAGSLYSIDWTGIDGHDDESYESRAECPSGTSVAQCTCNPIAMDARHVCAFVLYSAPYADFRTRNQGCYCRFQGKSQCQKGAFTMYVDCRPT